MGDEVRITVIATGFDRPSSGRSPLLEMRPAAREATQPIAASSLTDRAERSAQTSTPIEFQPHVMNTNDLDIPAFLRNRSSR
jgi:cell division protein FtsZ